MKRILLLLLTLATLSAEAQLYNNEWIDYNKTYYKFKIRYNGLYHIPQTTLASFGLGGANADDFQLWRNGEEVPLYTSEQHAPLAANGYLEFWGWAGDGKPDKDLYREPDYQLNDIPSLLSDSATFFLTVNPGGPNRRLETVANNVAGNTLPPEPFFMHSVVQGYGNRLNPGRSELVGDSYTYSSSYDYGEGWTSNDYGTGQTVAFNPPNLHVYTGPGAPAPLLKINASGNAVNPRYIRVKLNGDSIAGRTMDYYDYVKANIPLTTAQISGGANIEVTNMCSVPNDRMVIAKAELWYPRQFNFDDAVNSGYAFDLPANAAGNYLEITGFNYLGSAPVVWDITNGKRYVCDISNPSVVKVVLLPSAVDRHLMLVHQSPIGITTVSSMIRRNFIDYGTAGNQGDYLIITNPVLTAASGSGDPVEDYRAYRSSAQGGGFTARVYLTDQLEDQFGLGISKHPLSIRNFIRWARNKFSNPVKDILLIGKGVVYSQYRYYGTQPGFETLDLVPTFGDPASDILLAAEGNSSMPLTPIGRVSAISKDEVNAYLQKVKEYEALQRTSSPLIADRAWMKNVVHVVGANDVTTSNLLTAALDGHKQIIEDTLYGGNVETFTKSSADAVQQISSIRLTNLFNEGIGLLTYFGHSSASTLEFNLDNPQNYHNAGKYPVFIVMGCNAGSLFGFNQARFSTKETLSEKYVLANEGGSIAFLASTHLGIIHYLDIYNSKTYRAASVTKYGATLGEIMDESIRQVFALTTQDDFYARFQCEQFTLHGDPALRLYNFEKPDYVIEDPLVKVNPKFVSIAEPSFKVTATFMNIGRAPKKDIVVELKRTYPDQTTEVIRRDVVSFSKFSDSLTYIIPVVASRDKGLNKITVTVDADNTVDELYETNNTVTKDVYIIEDDVRPVYPYDYSIVSQQGIKFVASSANPFAVSRGYVMQLDTSELFTAPLATRSITSTGGVFEFDPGFSFTDSTVYYWRVAPPADASGETRWNGSSFQYIGNAGTGFSQAHFYQHLKSGVDRILLDSDRKWKFDSVTNNLFVKNGVWGTAITQEADLVVNVNDSSYIRNTCYYAIIFNVFDKDTFKPWLNQQVAPGIGLYGSESPACAFSRRFNFEFPNTAAGRNAALQFLRMIPDGDFVVVRNQVYSTLASNEYASNWLHDETIYGTGNSMYTELKTQGFTDIDSINRVRVFNFVYKKNAQAEQRPQFIISDGLFDAISLSVNCVTPDSVGYITSPLIGPAKNWKEVHWRGSSDDLAPGDVPSISLYGVQTEGGPETLLIPHLDQTQQDYDISSINAVQYPYLVMKMENVDSTNYTPYQLRYWMVNYNPAPEGAVAPNLYFTTKDTVEVGEPFNFGIAFKNISKVDFDSVKVKLSITDKDNVENIIPVPRQKDLAQGDTIKINVPIETKTLAGHNTIFINFNPDGDQPEEYLFNNYAFRSLYVKPDSLNPLLDVTFDGMHILNRDIVAAKPTILVKLKDDAKWMLLKDTSLMSVNVKYPDNTLHPYYFSNTDTIQFIPASQSSDNTASINFKPYFPQDGDYEFQVSGKDQSGNMAGVVQYRVAFQVINKPMISNMLNYPNPFTTSTAFVFTITGSEVPQNIRIQILTITGKIVREITKAELGPLRIGRNITEFKWDGTDQYGDKLANGIYLYRVITNLNGKSLDKYKAEGDNTDQYFNKGYGKMYLMR